MVKFEKPNIILIAIDTLRADHLSCYGYHEITSPNIDQLSKEGVIFDNCIAPGIPTHPGFTTILTGRHPLTHKIVCHAGKVQLSWEIKTLPEMLRDNGYLTAAIDNLVLTRGLWFVRGFEYYILSGGITVISRGAKISGEIVTRRAIQFLELWHKGYISQRPFFLFVHYWDPHTPYLPPKRFHEAFYKRGGTKLTPLLSRSKWGQLLLKSSWIQQLVAEGHDEKEYVDSLYDGEIFYVDQCVAKLIEKLKELEIYEDTAIIITSDHGEGLGENGIFYDHHGLYEWDIRIPLIIRAPGIVPPGKRIKELVTQEDITPTILNIANLPVPKNLDGISLISLINKEKKGRDFVVCLENTRMTKRAIRTRRWKLIETMRPDIYGKPSGHIELYDISKGERENLVDQESDIARELMFKLETWYRRKLGNEEDPLVVQPISLPVEREF